MKANLLIKILVLSIFISAFGLEWKSIYPSARRSATMIVDSLNQRIILFGGTSYYLNNRWYNDLWEMPLNNPGRYAWFPLSAAGNLPLPRCDHSAVYDQRHQRMLIFGGWVEEGLTNDVWSLDLTLGQERWERLNPSGTPPVPRYDAYTIYHPRRNSLIIFGGTGDYVWYNDLWELKLDSLVWREINVSGERPTPRGGGGEFFDRTNNRMIIFGGSAYSTWYNEVWALDLTPGNEQWSQLYPTGPLPTPRSDFSYGYDKNRNRFYIFCGWNYNLGRLFNDTYVLDLSSLTWTQLFPAGEIPEERRNIVGVYDYFNDNFFVFGGDMGGSYYLFETYYLQLPSGIGEWKMTSNLSTPYLSVQSPANKSCQIRFLLPNLEGVKIRILDLTGRLIKEIYSGKSLSECLFWDGTDKRNKKVGSGSYFCELETETEILRKRFIFLP
ncbi:MAG: kelch repeat-containing protein [candidate division WOR-3 bacterium]